MLLVDPAGRITLTNAQTEALCGYARNEIVGQSVDRFVPTRFRERHGEHRRHFHGNPQQRPMGVGRDLRVLHRDGREVPVEIGLSPIETSDGIFVLAAVTDISERKAIEAAREELLHREQEARAELEQASRLKDEFLAVLSHELRTPLNAVLGYAQLLTAGGFPRERAAHALNAIQRNAQAQARLIESLLDLSRIIAGKLELELKRLNVQKLVETAVDVVRPDADAKGIAINVQMPAREVTLVADGGRLQQVLWNLLTNAIKFTPPQGRIDVRVSDQDARLRIEVADTGQGISADFLPYVFERFKQDESHKRRSPTGLGLGLTVVRELVQAHGGTIVAESAGDGRGSTFTVTLPLSAVTVQFGRGIEDIAQLDEDAQSLHDVDVLVIDDDGDMRELLGLALDSRGAIVRAAPSAAAALDAISQRRPDVLLADILMPDRDGYWLIREVRAREQKLGLGRVPAIAVTAYASATDRARAHTAGYDWHVSKPVDIAGLLRVIARFGKTQSV